MSVEAPGKSFRKGITLIELFDLFPDDAAAEAWFEEQRWGTPGQASYCPLCGATDKLRAVESRMPLPFWCGTCRRHFSVRTGTVMHRSRIPLQKWAIAIYLWATSLKGVSSMKLHRDLGITQKSAYFLAQRLREAWSQTGDSMGGPIEADETYVGGKTRNMHARQALPTIDTMPERLAQALFQHSMPVPDVALHAGDCRDVLRAIPDETIHMVLTDPPYFLDRLDSGWNPSAIKRSQKHANAIGGLPVGMKFDRDQAKKLQAFLRPVANELMRVLKPGAFLLMFSSPRLYHRAAIAIEDAGFEVRDVFAWRFTRKAQFKAFTMDHFVERRQDMTPQEKAAALKVLDGRRTPQLRPQFEAILCAQKPREGTFVDNWMEHRTGLIDPRHSLTGRVPETVMTVEKEAKDSFNGHLTPKPVKLCEHLIQLFSAEGQMVLDPFVGSGSTCLAARRTGRNSIGIDINQTYIDIARERLT